MIVNDIVSVKHSVDAVTVMVAVSGPVVGFRAVKAGILPAPDAGKPMAGLEFVHVMEAPASGLVKKDIDKARPVHTILFCTGCNSIAGLKITRRSGEYTIRPQ